MRRKSRCVVASHHILVAVLLDVVHVHSNIHTTCTTSHSSLFMHSLFLHADTSLAVVELSTCPCVMLL